MKKVEVVPGTWWVDIPEEDLQILCGSPMNSIKYLIRLGLVDNKNKMGPNAVLLSDTPIQNGHFVNLCEFPVLQMLYMQGIKNPTLIGRSDVIDGIVQYIHYGNYGLLSKAEMRKNGIPLEYIDDLWAVKQKLSYGKFPKPGSNFNLVRLKLDKINITKNLTIQRIGLNRFRLALNDEVLDIDLNQPSGMSLPPFYQLDYSRSDLGGFSVVHLGEGSGWNDTKPCIGTLVVCKNRRYLVDAGPMRGQLLQHLGVDVNDLDGLFVTHIHDDHFAGMTDFFMRDQPLDVYASTPVIYLMKKKLESIIGTDGKFFDQLLNFHHLKIGEWNHIYDLQVRPALSPHPVETTVFVFRSKMGDDYKTYGYISDIPSRKSIEQYVGRDGVKPDFVDKIFDEFLVECNIKQVDSGGGAIHGEIDDFIQDPTPKIFSAHLDDKLKSEKPRPKACFGEREVLIPAKESVKENIIDISIRKGFPFFDNNIKMLFEKFEVSVYQPNIDLGKVEDFKRYFFLLLSGIVVRDPDVIQMNMRFTPGALIGEEEYFFDLQNSVYMTRSHICALKIPAKFYKDMLRKANCLDMRLENLKKRRFLCRSNFPGDKVGIPGLDRLSEQSEMVNFRMGTQIVTGKNSLDHMYLLYTGEMLHKSSTHQILPGQWLNLDRVIEDKACKSPQRKWKFTQDSCVIVIPGQTIRGIPVLQWTFRELIICQ